MTGKSFVLDACALIALLNQEEGSEIIRDLLRRAEHGSVTVRLHAVNLCEVYYDCLRVSGGIKAEALLKTVEIMPIFVEETIDGRLLREVGRIKASEKLSLADAFAVGLAITSKARLLTSDHHELEPLQKKGIVKIEWFR